MKTKMRDVFESAVRRWVEAWGVKTRKEHPDIVADPDALLEKLNRFPTYVALRLGMALHDKTLVTDTGPRGYFIGPPGKASHMMLTRRGNQVSPCWEMFVHMAEYASLAAMARVYPELDVRIEDALMDLTVRIDGRLVAYIEVKHERGQAERLVDGLLALEGRTIEPGPKLPDPIRKALYLLKEGSTQPVALAVRAGDAGPDGIYERTFIATATNGRLSLTESSDPVPLQVELDALGGTSDVTTRSLACLVWHMERSAPVILTRGTRGTYLVYRDCDPATRVLVGTEKNGAIYTVLDALDDGRLQAFETCLNAHGLTLGDISSGTDHRIWKSASTGKPVSLTNEDAARAIGRALAEFVAG